MPLSDLFIPDASAVSGLTVAPGDPPLWLHRARALAALEADLFELHLETASSATGQTPSGHPAGL